MTKIVKADLHMHPSFYSPRDSKKAPSLLRIINTLFSKGLGIVSLSACHPKPKDIDYRFFDYMNQIPVVLTETRYEADYREGIFLHIGNKGKKLILLNSQEVRTDYRGMPADINIIGVKRIVGPGKDIDETAKIGKGEEGIVTICYANSACGSGIEKALEMYHNKQVDAIEINASASVEEINTLGNKLHEEGIVPLTVSDSHHLSQAGISYALLDESISDGFSIGKLQEKIRAGEFDFHIGNIGALSKFWYHSVPIILSIPVHLAKNPKYIINALTKRKQ